MIKLKWFFALFLILIFSGNTFAQQIQTTPITPQGQSTPSITQPSPSIQPFQPSQPIPSQPLQSQPPAPEGVIPQATPQPAQQPPTEGERPSEFEQFISGKVSLTVSTDIKQFGYD